MTVPTQNIIKVYCTKMYTPFSPNPALGTCRFWCGSCLCTLQIITHSHQLLVHDRLTCSVFLPYSVSAEHDLHCVSVDHSLPRVSVEHNLFCVSVEHNCFCRA